MTPEEYLKQEFARLQSRERELETALVHALSRLYDTDECGHPVELYTEIETALRIDKRIDALTNPPPHRPGFCSTYGFDYSQTRVAGGWQCDLCGELVTDEEPNNLLTRLNDTGFGSAGPM